MLPSETPAAAARRRELFSTWESEPAVNQRLSDLQTLRRDGQVLAVWVRELGEFRYPKFQFNPDGQVVPEMKPLLEILTGPSGLVEAENLGTGWRLVEWFYCRHALLNAQAPAECFAADPAAVLAVAQREFVLEGDQW